MCCCLCTAGPDRREFTPPVHNTQSTVHSHSTIKCNLSVRITKKFSLKMTQQVRNMWECVTIDDKTLFVHLLVSSVFVCTSSFNVHVGGRQFTAQLCVLCETRNKHCAVPQQHYTTGLCNGEALCLL
jgi:hypothetical protein